MKGVSILVFWALTLETIDTSDVVETGGIEMSREDVG
jgi:hypothetical protein